MIAVVEAEGWILALILVLVPVVVTGAFGVYNGRQNREHELEAAARKVANTEEHSAVMTSLNHLAVTVANLNETVSDHLSWHVEAPAPAQRARVGGE